MAMNSTLRQVKSLWHPEVVQVVLESESSMMVSMPIHT